MCLGKRIRRKFISHIKNSICQRSEFVQAMVHTHNTVLLQVFTWTHEVPPDPKRILDTYFDGDQSRLATYQLQVCLVAVIKRMQNISLVQDHNCVVCCFL